MKQVKPNPQASPTRPAVSVVTITPEIAEAMLGKNISNRNVRQAKVDAYARDMSAGKWVFNGESIKLTEDGTVIDGQHRLMACVKSGETFSSVVVRDLAPEAQNTVDTGARRNYSDQLGFAGEKNKTVLASALRRVVMWDQGYKISAGTYQPTEREMSAYLEKNPDIRLSADMARYARRYLNCPPSTTALVHHLFNRIDPSDCERFFQQWVDGIGVEYGDPVHALRKKMAEDFGKGGDVSQTQLLGYICHTWNLFRDGKKTSRLMPPRGKKPGEPNGYTNENFPMPR